MSVDSTRRAARPLRALTDDELVALSEMSRLAHYLREPFAQALGDISELAGSEVDERELARALGR